MRAILDTRFFFSYFNPENEEIARWSKEVIRRAPELGISAITVVELYRSMGRTIGLDVTELRLASMKAKGISIIPVSGEIVTAIRKNSAKVAKCAHS